MKHTRLGALVLAIGMLFGMAACSENPAPGVAGPETQIFLYGEAHGDKGILEKELELWRGYYHNEGMRHLFVEYPYYTAEFLNLWMAADNDDILDALYDDWAGTAAQVPAVKDFYKQLKLDCPETVFHGTDVGHQYTTTGVRYLKYLAQNGLGDSQQSLLAQQAIEQGKAYYKQGDGVYRENMMAENFAREFDSLGGERVMGIYGAAHTSLTAKDFSGKVPCMANQLQQQYGDSIYSEDLSQMANG